MLIQQTNSQSHLQKMTGKGLDLSHSNMPFNPQQEQLTQLQNELSCLYKPTEQQMSIYLKKVFLQTVDINDHVDNIRKNYLKRKQFRQSSTANSLGKTCFLQNINANKMMLNNSIQLNHINERQQSFLRNHGPEFALTSSNLLNQSVRARNDNEPSSNKSINSQYLKQLEDQYKKSTLPEQIRSNKLLCSLYQKLDSFQNNLKIEHEKQILTQKIQKEHQQDKNNSGDQLLGQADKQFYNVIQESIQVAKSNLTEKQEILNQIRQKLLTAETLGSFKNIMLTEKLITNNQNYIEELCNHTQSNLNKISERITLIESLYQQVRLKKGINESRKKQILELKLQLKSLFCELQRRKSSLM